MNHRLPRLMRGRAKRPDCLRTAHGFRIDASLSASAHNGHMPGPRSPFEVLGLPPTATEAQVKAAYRTAARRLHPDTGGDAAAFRELAAAAALATSYASGKQPNPYLPTDDHTLYVPWYDRHAHAPAPPPNIWRSRYLGGGLFWILPVAGAIFMLSGATGPYFLPVWLGSMAALAGVALLVARRRSKAEKPRPDNQHGGDAEEDQPGP